MQPARPRLFRRVSLLVAALLASPLVAAEFAMNVTAAGIGPGTCVAGPILSAEALANRVVLLDFWGLDCPPCIRSMLFDHTGKCIYRGSPFSAQEAVVAALKGQIRSLAQGIAKACPGSTLSDKATAIATELAPATP